VVSSRTPRSANPRAGSSSGSSDRARSYISADSAPRSASPSPAAPAASSSSSSDSSRNFSGSRSVHRQTARPQDSDSSPPASAATTAGCVPARFAHAVWPAAAPRVIPVWCISQARAL